MIWGRWGNAATKLATVRGQNDDRYLGSLGGRLGKHSVADTNREKKTEQGGVDVRFSDACRIYQYGEDLSCESLNTLSPPWACDGIRAVNLGQGWEMYRSPSPSPMANKTRSSRSLPEPCWNFRASRSTK